LIRVELSAETPPAVREAVESADAELDGVGARVPAVRIEITPADAAEVTLEIDGQAVSSAVVGVDRPLNPGRHRIEASVPDGRKAEKWIELREGAREAVLLELGPKPASSPAAAVPEPARASSASLAGFAGIGVGLWLPLGEVAAGVPVSDYAGLGAGLELQVGLRFARYFGAKLFAEGARLSARNPPNESFGSLATGANPSAQVKLDSTVAARNFGLSLLVGSAPRKLGAYGELGLVWQRLELARDVTFGGNGACGANTSQSLVLTGAALRVGGGASIPLSSHFELSPFAHGTFGRFTNSELGSGCEELPGPAGLGAGLAADERGFHTQLVLGVGGNFVFGPR
jgi:hypothetical protein